MAGGGSNTVVLVKVDARVVSTVLPWGNHTASLLCRTDIRLSVDLEQALGLIHVGVVAELPGGLLEVLDTLLRLT